MSYGFDLFPGEAGFDEAEVLDLLDAADEENADIIELETRNQKIIAAIQLLYPHFDKYIDDFTYELTSQTEIQIYLSRRSLGIGVSIPYWYQDITDKHALDELKQYLQLIQKITQYAIFDSQIGEVIDLNRDWDAVLNTYGYGVNQTKKLIDDTDE